MFAYTTPLIGGLLIGASAVALLYFLGRIAGIAGIVWGAVSAQPDNAWRWLFIAGLLAGPLAYHFLAGVPNPAPSPLPWWQAVAGGLLVGIGVRLGSGCTSGHGVCGIGRLSPRSLVATLTFMATGIITVYVIRHVLGEYLP
ncbi:MAG: YeeE/YedE family protein [Pseudomonadales bacterium]|nr:YeeE/YedE family protein [Pseudomonadales bacterium]